MTNKEKRTAIITGTLLFALAAFFSISVILGILDFGSMARGSNVIYRFGVMLVSVYGVCSLFIPAFFFVAGCFCFDARWSLQRMFCLLVSIIPFFTLAFAERTARNIASSDSSPIAAVKITVLLVIALLLVAAEYLVTMVLAGIAERKIREQRKTSGTDISSEEYDDNIEENEEDFSADDGIEPYQEPKKKSDEEEISQEEFLEEENIPEEEKDPIEAQVEKSINDAVEEEGSWSLAEILSKNRKSIEKAVNEEPKPVEITPAQMEKSSTEEKPSQEEIPMSEEIQFVDETPVTEEAPLSPEAPVEKVEPLAEEKIELVTETPVAEEIPVTKEEPVAVTEAPVEKATPVTEEKSQAKAEAPVTQETNVSEGKTSVHTQAPEEKPAPLAEAKPQSAKEAPVKEQNKEQKPHLIQEEGMDPLSDPWNVTQKIVNRALAEKPKPAPVKEEEQEQDALDEAEAFAENEIFEEDDIIAEFERGSINLDEDEDLSSFDEAAEEEESGVTKEMEEMFEEDDESDASFMDIPDEMEFIEPDDEMDFSETEEAEPEAEPEEEAELIEEEAEEEINEPEEILPDEIPSQEKKTADEKPHSMLSALDSVFARMDADVKKNFDPTAPAPIDSNGNKKSEEKKTEEKRAVHTDEKGNTTPIKVPAPKPKPKRRGTYKIPTDLLTAYDENPYWIIDSETTAAAENLKSTLKEFKIEAEVTGIKKGPVVTMFEILPAPGVKLSKIVALQDNIALRLAASSVRIVAPIPGKHAVGIEVPNKDRAIISMRECLEMDVPEWKKMAVPVVLGKDIQGGAQIIDLAKTPHLLIAGSTGAGKSVCVNSMILSILYKRSPAEVKMILIDPKIVELKLYNDIPHLLTPVITEPKRAMQSLQYCLCEMERRYALLDHLGVRDISSYNKKIVEKGVIAEKLPYLIVIIDEFADLMATTGKQLEGVLARLAAMSRAVGIHLVLATQRPSIDVITGLIKANIPSRIAFMVASKMDSRIIIDQVGAEKLLGKGDMLYASATDPFPVRIQGTFVSDQEVEDVVNEVKTWGEPEYIDDEIFVDDDEDGDGDQMSLFNAEGEDPLYDKALEIVVQTGKASASYIQRKLKIGYNRAARLVEEMEERGIVGPANGSKPRELIHVP